jgi:predicted metal-dependent phosphoesterase TrpH
MGGKIDLHLHTTFSDGSYSPEQIIEKARASDLETISITDHDTIDALPSAETACREAGIELISGIEFTTYILDREVHILSYFFDRENRDLLRLISFCKDERMFRARRIIKKLADHGVDISLDEVLEEAKDAPITRPHIASAVFKKGIVKNYFDIFDLYLGNEGPCYEKKIFIDPITIFDLAHKAGGVSMVAHPGMLPEAVIDRVIELGVDGLEVIHPSHTDFQMKTLANLANSNFLLSSGGSDFHGGKKNDEGNFGKFLTPPQSLAQMRRKAGKEISRQPVSSV